MKVEHRAMRLAENYFTRQGYSVQDVSRTSGHNGYDLFIARGQEQTKVEVKGCTRAWQIPDLFSTEFNANKILIADILCVVYFLENKNPSICLIPRDAIQPCDVVEKKGYRISSRFKKQAVLEKYLAELPSEIEAMC